MKKFLGLVSVFIIPYFLVVLYYAIFIQGRVTGDLGKMGEIPFGQEYDEFVKPEKYPPSHLTEGYRNTDHTKYKIITIGDSFSEQGQLGYQNYLANIIGCEILNLNVSSDPEQSALWLLKSGYFENSTVKYVIVESVLRYAFDRLNALDFNEPTGKPILINNQQQRINNPPKYNEAITLDKIFRFATIRLKIRKPIIKEKLTIPAFSSEKYEKELFCYELDLKFRNITSQEVKNSEKKLLELKEYFNEAGINFIYLLAADKSSVYQEFIADELAPTNNPIQELENVINQDWFIETQTILSEMVSNGVKDVYPVNDTHWSYLGSERVAKEIYSRNIIP